MPLMIDPQGKLSAEVQADIALGNRLGVTYTPTIFIVMPHAKDEPYIKVQNPQQDLFQDIDKAVNETHP